MGTNFHTAFTTATRWLIGDVNPAPSDLDKAITYLKNVMVSCAGIITYNKATGVLTWSDVITILFNDAAGLAKANTIAAGDITIADNQFVYVTLSETNDAVLTAAVATVTTASASDFIANLRLVLGYRNTTSDEFYPVYLKNVFERAPDVLIVPEGTPVNAVAAVGTITMSGIAVAEETFVVGTQTFTWKAARSITGEVTIGISASEAVTNIVTAITADLATVTAVDGDGDTVVVTAVTKGVSGNSILFSEVSTNMAVNGAGFLGGTTPGVDGTVGFANEIKADANYLYHCIADNPISGINWRRITLGSAY